MVTHFCMNGVGEIDRRRSLGQLLHRTLRSKHIDDVVEELQFDRIHELPVVRQILLPLDEFPEPAEGLAVFVIDPSLLLVLPMGRNSILSHPMHVFRANLKLHMLAFRPYDGRMERLIEIGLGNRDVILEPARQRTPQGMDHAERGVTIHFGIGDDSQRRQVVDLFERNRLFVHFLIDAVQMLRPPINLSDQPVVA